MKFIINLINNIQYYNMINSNNLMKNDDKVNSRYRC